MGRPRPGGGRNRWRRVPALSADVFNPLRSCKDPLAVWRFVGLCVLVGLYEMCMGQGEPRGKRQGNASKHKEPLAVWRFVGLCILFGMYRLFVGQGEPRGKRPGKGSKRKGKLPGKRSVKRPEKRSVQRSVNPGKRKRKPPGRRPGVAPQQPSKLSAPAQVFVRTDAGERCVELSLGWTVADAKAAILSQCAPPGARPCPTSFWIRFSGKALMDSQTLESAGVRAGSNLSLEVRVRGGGGGHVPSQKSGVVPDCQQVACVLIANSAVETSHLNADAEVATLLEALVTDQGDAARVSRACVALSLLGTGRQEEIIAAGAIESVLAAMAVHKGDANVQHWGFTALQNVVDRSHAAKARIAAAGGLAQILSAMDLHSDSACVQLASCRLLLSMSANDQVRGAIKAAGGDHRVQRAMAAQDADAQILISGSGLTARLGGTASSVPPQAWGLHEFVKVQAIASAQEARTERLNRLVAPDAEQTTATSAGAKPPVRQRIGLTEPRHERGPWKEEMEAPVDVHAKDRDAATDVKILRG